MSLGKWAVIDIETTGINPGTDEIIDLGFLQFEGTKLVKKYSSLVRPQHEISQYISKLTGITQEMLKKAPLWSQVENDLLELEGHSLIAHNARFEQSFLEKFFDKVRMALTPQESFQDSLLFLALLFPQSAQLNLESFLVDMGLAEKEQHRGFEDSLDLLKVMLLGCYFLQTDRELKFKLREVFQRFQSDFWFKHFVELSQSELLVIAEQIDFDLEGACKKLAQIKTNHEAETSFQSRFRHEFSKANLESILRSEKEIQELLPRYKYRDSQEQLAVKVGQAFKNKIHALIQAPTGTGKTMGYLIPSMLFSLSEKEPCLIATGTKTLQDQAINKDVPQTLDLLHLRDKIKVVKLIGSNNHLCELLFRENFQEDGLLYNFEEVFVNSFFDLLFFHNSKAPQERKITREQLPFVLKKIIPLFQEKERELAVDYRACVGPTCPLIQNCSYIQGLKEAKEAQIIIGNHALMLNWPRSLPRPSHIVVDEAHKIEQEATAAFTVEVTHQTIESLIKNLPQGMGALIYLISSMEEEFQAEDKVADIREKTQFNLRMLRDHIDALPTLIESLFKKLPHFSPAYSNELPFPREQEAKDELTVIIRNHLSSAEFILESLYQIYLPYMSRWETKDFKGEVQKLKAFAVFEMNFSSLEKHALAFKHFLSEAQDWATVMKFSEQDGYSLESSPIDVGKKVFDELLLPSSSVVFTSATLANSQGDTGVRGVEWMTGYSFLPAEKRFKSGLFLDAVYDYKNKSKVFLCSDTKPLSDPKFVESTLDQVCPIIDHLGGRTLLLFSSRLRFEQAVDYLLRKYEGKLPVFVQGLGKNVVELFKKEASAILIGMESFGEGIDIPGEKLQFIFIDKIPDVRQDIVIQKRRDFYEAKFGNEFTDYFLAQRTRSLQQKLGRLLRTETDHGAILIVDCRTKKWKGITIKTFQKLMEPYDIQLTNLSEASQRIIDYFQV